MRRCRHLTALAVAAVLAVPACASPDDEALPDVAPPTTTATAPAARLCDAIPGPVVARATGASPVTVEGAGTQCTWREAGGDRVDPVLQGSFIDVRSFDLGRPAASAATEVTDVGDAAYLVREGEQAPTTLYVRDGSVAFALWLADPDASEPEGTLAHLARQVLAD